LYFAIARRTVRILFLDWESPFEKGTCANPKPRHFMPFEFLDHTG